MREAWTDLALRVDRNGDDLFGPRMNQLPMTAFARAMLDEASFLQPTNEFTPRHENPL